jgi:hypothetical protein
VHVLHGPRQCSLYALCMLSVYPTCVPTRYLLTLAGKKAGKAAYLLVSMVGHGFGSQGHHRDGLVRINQHPGLRARVIPACCTGGPHCNKLMMMITNTLVCMFGWFRPVALGGLIVTNL